MYEVDRERVACLNDIARHDGFELDAAGTVSFVGKLPADEFNGKFASVNRTFEFAHQVRKGSDMIFMAVRNKDSPDAVLVLEHICIVLDNSIDSRHVFFREGHSAVDNNDIIAKLKQRHILADLVETSKRDDTKGAFFLFFVFRLCETLLEKIRHFLFFRLGGYGWFA